MTLLIDAVVVETAQEGPYRRLRLYAPALGIRLAPGQFVTADLGDLLRQPLLPATMDEEGLETLLLPDHPAAALEPGQIVSLLGPLGSPLRLPQPPARLLLVADDLHLPALLAAASRALDGGCPTALLLSAPTASTLYPLSYLPPPLEVQVITGDGSSGREGTLATEGELLASLLQWADRVLIASDPAFYPAMAEAVRNVRIGPPPDFAQAWVLPPLVCGVGACQGCAVATRGGYRLACTDGPAFDLMEMAF